MKSMGAERPAARPQCQSAAQVVRESRSLKKNIKIIIYIYLKLYRTWAVALPLTSVIEKKTWTGEQGPRLRQGPLSIWSPVIRGFLGLPNEGQGIPVISTPPPCWIYANKEDGIIHLQRHLVDGSIPSDQCLYTGL
ncbi:hypothetical protein GDO78_019609 [Eleutherodactylus coqui]|uniref:Uncharacterized protein n=1 Tax=Eleutherodactylus coqui TaxID=57060 RepID=A0A8J6EBQ9_ELECQ|nr:hypothetical protein GDO78_019609 [Eleutherodactylus coqui]